MSPELVVKLSASFSNLIYSANQEEDICGTLETAKSGLGKTKTDYCLERWEPLVQRKNFKLNYCLFATFANIPILEELSKTRVDTEKGKHTFMISKHQVTAASECHIENAGPAMHCWTKITANR